MVGFLEREVRKRLPARARQRLRARLTPGTPALGRARRHGLRRLEPVSRSFGFERGTPIDRVYIEDFLRRHSGGPDYGTGDIQGHVLEVGGDEYVRRFGGWTGSPAARAKVLAVDVLHATSANPQATIVGDLTTGEGLRNESFDCVICTQTLHFIYDVRPAVQTLHDILRPGGVALVTVAGIAPAARPDRDLWGDYWRFTTLSARRLFEEAFAAADVTVEAYGNVLSASAFLQGLAAEELRPHELSARDPDYEMLIAIRARREPVARGSG